MPLHEWSEVDPKTSVTVYQQINACPDEKNCKGLVTWMKFQKVAQTKENTIDGDGEYGGDDGVKFQTEWLPVEGSPLQFFIHLRITIDAYFPHAYKVNLSGRVDKFAERAFIVDPVARDNCPD